MVISHDCNGLRSGRFMRQMVRMTSAASAGPASPAPGTDPGFAVYVHWPFCAQKCPYCDFNSHVRRSGWDEAAYLACYLRELRHMHELAPDRAVRSVFFGGGTPSLMQPRTVEAILSAIAGLWPVERAAEITLEANPSSVEAGRFLAYRSAGVNRVSLGVQSLVETDLRALGRLHSVSEALQAIEIAARTFDRYSFDLIYARPRQTVGAWQAELRMALSLVRNHISLYQLTIEPGTAYAALHAAGRLAIPDADLADRLFEVTQELTEARSLPAYEISNHAIPGEECRHNLVYWRYGEYAGVGPGAHGRLVSGGKRLALATERNPEAWKTKAETGGHGLVESTALSAAETGDEFLLMGLRLAEGIELSRLATLAGVRPARGTVDRLVALGHLEQPAAGRLAATRRGRFVLNEVVRRLAESFEPVV
jgi:oxygen-independent coproporphyrinogen-3 oxidase